MLHYDSWIRQQKKDGHHVSGDQIVHFSFKDSYYFAIFDGVGSGVYANIAAIGNAGRWSRMIREGISISEASETIASSMRTKEEGRAFYTAFSALMLTRHGNALLYTFESPKAILRRGRAAQVLEPYYYDALGTTLGETQFELEENDTLFIFSDGISQAGMGQMYPLGWQEKGAASYIQVQSRELADAFILDRLIERCRVLSGGSHADDTSAIMIRAIRAKHLHLFSGPPVSPLHDKKLAERFDNAQGVRVICGSSTAGIISRELGVRLHFLSEGDGLHSPPQYKMNGAELVTEGALALNQAANLLLANTQEITGDTPPEQLTRLLLEADVIDIYEGTAQNEAHRMLLFKQLGIRSRKEALRVIAQALEQMGKRIHYHSC